MKKMKVNVCIMAFFIITMLIVSFGSAVEQNTPFSQLQLNNSSKNVNIQKGFSLFTDNDTYQIPIGSIIYYSKDGITRVFDANKTLLLTVNDTDTQKISTSAGDFFASKRIGIPNGSFIKENSNSTTITLHNQSILSVIYEKNLSLEKEKNLSIKNIVGLPDENFAFPELVNSNTVNDLRYFTANWTIPKPPRSTSPGVQVDFWNGIESMDAPFGNHSLIQPVTSWKRTSQWTSYGVYVNAWGNFYYSESTLHSDVGDIVQGYMYWHDEQYWDVVIIEYPSGNPPVSPPVAFSVQSPYLTEDNNFVICALETHHISAPSDLPGGTTFYDIKLKDLYNNNIVFNWNTFINTTVYQPELHVLNVYTPSQSRATLFAIGDKIGTFNNGYWNLDYNLDHISDRAFTFGTTGDIPVVGDWNGDGTSDVGVFRPSTGNWYLETAKTGTIYRSFHFGTTGDIPVVGDWNGDGTSDVGVFRPSTGNWYLETAKTGTIYRSFHFGTTGDIPVVGDWEGTGSANVGVFRPVNGNWYLDNTQTGVVWRSFHFGTTGDKPVVGYWDINRVSDVGVFRPSTGNWYLETAKTGTIYKSFHFGTSTDTPIVGDWDGPGISDVGVFRPANGNWYFDFDANGGVDYNIQFGTSSDTPIVGKWV